ncbi:MAG TPA: GNAT family N-acetyltransferase [Pyrinomonadaceae bacterium]|nr:GNAT family N-acetyltransferase [Pyrinomonadaceae bacterium]
MSFINSHFSSQPVTTSVHSNEKWELANDIWKMARLTRTAPSLNIRQAGSLSYSTNMNFKIEEMQPAHWRQVCEIYRQGLRTGQATFEVEVPAPEKWDARHFADARLVATSDTGGIIGWAALSPVSTRAAYAGVAEVSVYVGERHRGQRVGQELLKVLVAESEKMGVWTLQASIFPENEASIKIHRNCGFREVGRRERIGKLNGVWRDTVLMERRRAAD